MNIIVYDKYWDEDCLLQEVTLLDSFMKIYANDIADFIENEKEDNNVTVTEDDFYSDSDVITRFCIYINKDILEIIYQLLKEEYKNSSDKVVAYIDDAVWVYHVSFSSNEKEQAKEFIIKTMKETGIVFDELAVYCTKSKV